MSAASAVSASATRGLCDSGAEVVSDVVIRI